MMQPRLPETDQLVDWSALRQTARSLARSGSFAGWREVQKEMLDAGLFGTATLFMNALVAAEIDALCKRRKPRSKL